MLLCGREWHMPGKHCSSLEAGQAPQLTELRRTQVLGTGEPAWDKAGGARTAQAVGAHMVQAACRQQAGAACTHLSPQRLQWFTATGADSQCSGVSKPCELRCMLMEC